MNQIVKAERKGTNWINQVFLFPTKVSSHCFRVELHIFSYPGLLKRWSGCVSCLTYVCADLCVCVWRAFSCLLSVTFQLYIWEHAEFCKGCHSKVSCNGSLPPVSQSLSFFCSSSLYSSLCLTLSIILFGSLAFISLCGFFVLVALSPPFCLIEHVIIKDTHIALLSNPECTDSLHVTSQGKHAVLPFCSSFVHAFIFPFI